MAQAQTVPRKTIYIPDGAERLVRKHAREGESFSATVVRLIELGAVDDAPEGAVDESEFPLGYIGAGKGGPPILRSTRRNISA